MGFFLLSQQGFWSFCIEFLSLFALDSSNRGIGERAAEESWCDGAVEGARRWDSYQLPGKRDRENAYIDKMKLQFGGGERTLNLTKDEDKAKKGR